MIEGVQSINLTPNEIVFPGSQIVLETGQALDRDHVERAVGVRGAGGKVKLSRDRQKVTWTPGDDATPGWYDYEVDSLISERGRQVSPGGRVRFGLVRSSARIPKGVAVESMVRLRVGRYGVTVLPLFADQGRGKYLEMMKARERATGAPVALAFDETGTAVDADEVMAGIAAARVKRFGKLEEDLDRLLRRSADDERVSVAVWAQSDDDIEPTDKLPDRSVDDDDLERLSARRVEAAQTLRAGLGDEVARVGGEAEPDDIAPVVYTKLTKRAIRRLQRSEQVSAIFRYDPRGFDDLDDSLAIANSDNVHDLGEKGAGVRVAVWERGPANTSDLSIAGTFDPAGDTSPHSTLVHAVIKNTEEDEPNGHAPECDLYSANSYDLAALRWAVGDDQRCSVINQSFHRDDEQTSGSLSFDDIYKDWLILRRPWPTIIQAAGNGPDEEFVNHKGYNSLTVASHNDDASALAATSVSGNPTTSHADRELPEIAANGTNVSAAGETNGGTSFASPAVVGITALLQGDDSTLTRWPEGCRAILIAGATRNVSDDTWWQDVADGTDAADGSGAVNALEAYHIVQFPKSPNAAASRRGWDVGVLDDSDFGGDGYNKFTYKVSVPRWWLGPTHVKVGLAWNSKVKEFSFGPFTFPLSSQLEQDLDLRIYDSEGTLVTYSQSWDNSYEIAEFDAKRGEDYTIKIRRWSGTGWTWYGVAWTVTGGWLDLFRLRTLAFEQDLTDRFG